MTKSVPAPYSREPMKVSSKLRLAKKHEVMICACTYTGIAIEIGIPSIEGFAFEYQNPLSIYANVKGILSRNHDYLQSLDLQILAGLFITAYRHYDLIEAYDPKGKVNGAALNALIRTAGKDVLVYALEFIKLVNSGNCHKLPSMSLDFAAHKDAVSMAPAIQNYVKLLRGILDPSSIPKADKNLRDTVAEKTTNEAIRLERESFLERRGTGTIKSYTGLDRRKNAKKTDKEREFEERFQRAKKQAKAAVAEIASLGSFSPKFLHLLNSMVSNRNLIAVDNALRNKIILKLEEKPCAATELMARIFRDCKPEDEDIFAPSLEAAKEENALSVSSSEADAVDSKVNAPVKLSAEEKIAALKAKIAAAKAQKGE